MIFWMKSDLTRARSRMLSHELGTSVMTATVARAADSFCLRNIDFVLLCWLDIGPSLGGAIPLFLDARRCTGKHPSGYGVLPDSGNWLSAIYAGENRRVAFRGGAEIGVRTAGLRLRATSR